jgi:hypothetical protein
MRSALLRVGLVVAVAVGVLIPAQAAFADFTDVPTTYWDYTAIEYVGVTHTWMQDYGTSTFLPTTREHRGELASALVKAYAPNEPIDPNITFPDLPTSDPLYPFANVAVKLGWIQTYTSGKFAAGDPVHTDLLDRSLILATGEFSSALAGLASIGSSYTIGDRWPHSVLAHWLGLHYNHTDETQDVGPSSYLHRDEVAYALWMAETLESWQISAANSTYDVITLPNLTDQSKKDLTQEAFDQVGFPYIYAGEWNAKSPAGYCCGTQPQGGYDCSGFAWWDLKKNEGGYDAAQYRTYAGWSLPERSSSDMAKNTITQLAYSKLKVGDLMFFASDGGTSYTDVDHVGVYIGMNWMMHSSSSTDGPVLEWVGSGYYSDTFVYGRRVLGVAAGAPIHLSPEQLAAGDRGTSYGIRTAPEP